MEAGRKGCQAMLEIECYINPKKPGLLLYVEYGRGLAGIANASDWVFDSTVGDKEVPAHLQDEIGRTGHAFQQLPSSGG
jgi:hypothetical protein